MYPTRIILAICFIGLAYGSTIEKRTSEQRCYDEATDTFLTADQSVPSMDGSTCTCRAPLYEMQCSGAKRSSERVCYDENTGIELKAGEEKMVGGRMCACVPEIYELACMTKRRSEPVCYDEISDTFIKAGEERLLAGRLCTCVPDVYELACMSAPHPPCLNGHSVCFEYAVDELDDYCPDASTGVAEICCASCQGHMKRDTQQKDEKRESEPMCLYGDTFLHAGESVYEGDHICTCTGDYNVMCSRAFEKRGSSCTYNGAFVSVGSSIWEDPSGDSVCTCGSDSHMMCSRTVAKKSEDGWWCPLPGGGELPLGADAFLTPGDSCMRCTCKDYGGEISLGCVPCFDLTA